MVGSSELAAHPVMRDAEQFGSDRVPGMTIVLVSTIVGRKRTSSNVADKMPERRRRAGEEARP